jgi:hypothetical protein
MRRPHDILVSHSIDQQLKRLPSVNLGKCVFGGQLVRE